jgi:acetyl esterase
MDTMDPAAAAAVAEIEALGVPEWHTLSVEAARRLEDRVFTPDSLPTLPFVRDLAIEGTGGEIPLRVYRPAPLPRRAGTDDAPGDDAPGDEGPVGGEALGDDAPADRDTSASGETPAEDAPAGGDGGLLPTLVFYHGGGWTLGTLDSAGGICRELARRAGCVVVSVDYRLAPEHPFPAPVEDAETALSWVAANAHAFGGDPDRVAVGGTSAGGALAAAVSLWARDFGDVDVAHQLLAYPATDYAFDTESYRENADGPLLTRADMEWFWAQYLRTPLDGANPYAAPMRARDVSDLPPATVVTGGFDPLRDDGLGYADRLAHAGVDVERVHAPRLPHGFLSLAADVPAADAAMDDVAASLRAGLGP